MAREDALLSADTPRQALQEKPRPSTHTTASLYGDQASRVLTSADLHPECDLGKILYGLPVNSGAAFLPRSSQMHLYLPSLSSEPFLNPHLLAISTMRELFLSIPKPYPRALSGP